MTHQGIAEEVVKWAVDTGHIKSSCLVKQKGPQVTWKHFKHVDSMMLLVLMHIILEVSISKEYMCIAKQLCQVSFLS